LLRRIKPVIPVGTPHTATQILQGQPRCVIITLRPAGYAADRQSYQSSFIGYALRDSQ